MLTRKDREPEEEYISRIIGTAFDDAEFPGESTALRPNPRIDALGDSPRLIALAGHRYEIDYGVLCDGIWELSLAAFRYYLPGLMRFCIRARCETQATTTLETLLVPEESNDGEFGRNSQHFLDRVAVFNDAEKNAIANFWRLGRDKWPEALLDETIEQSHFWDQFL